MLIEEIKAIQSTRTEVRKFGLTLGPFLLLLGGVLFWFGKSSAALVFSIGALLAVLGLILPLALKPVYRIWMTFATILGWFMTRVILSILYFLVITPIGLIGRLLGKPFLDLKSKPDQSSYWNALEIKEKTQEEFERQF